ncbi:hypothetical protein BZA05DRAFT_390682, partial [Tricharina praecox]|uniref:uncharacterized protein n=1 Tax=Tricharina praecox TaxID=43433 RepID=UPI0022207E8B
IFIQLNGRLCSWKYRQVHSTILLTSRKNNASIDQDERPSIGLTAATNHLPIWPGHLSRVRHCLTLGSPSSRHSFQSRTKLNSRLTLDPIPSRSAPPAATPVAPPATPTARRTTSRSTGRSSSCTGRTRTPSRSTGYSTGRTTSRSTGHTTSGSTDCTTNLNSSCPSSST